MPSRLSSLLVRDGLVGVKRMEKAFQRQVIYGGCLDTILLEMNLIPEERLVQYLSLATGLPPATRDETNLFDADAIKGCAEDIARAFRVVPLCTSDGALRVLVHDPVDLARMEELADVLDVPIQPLVVPEYRFHVVFARAYGGTPDARFTKLAKQAEEASPIPPVGRAKSIIVEEEVALRDEPDREIVDVTLPPGRLRQDPRTRTLEFATGALARRIEEARAAEGIAASAAAAPDAAPVASGAVADVVPAAGPPPAAGPGAAPDTTSDVAPDTTSDAAPDTTSDAAPGTSSDAAPASAGETTTDEAEELHADNDAASAAGPGGNGAPARALPTADTPLPPPVAPQPSPRSLPADMDIAPLTATAARKALAEAEDRDLIFALLLRAIRSQAWFAGLLTVQGGAAIGRIGIVGDRLDREDIPRVLIPLEDAPSFHTAVASASPYIGPIATGDAEIDSMLERMGGVIPPAALLLPIALKNRVVAIAVGHRGGETIGIAEVSELLPLAGAAAEALSRLIMKNKALGYRAVDRDGDAVPEIVEAELPTRRIERADGAWSVPEKSETPEDQLEFGTEMSIEAEEPASIEELIDAIEGGSDDVAVAAIEEALTRPDEILAYIDEAFPGPLLVDRHEMSSGGGLRAAQHGRVLDLVTRLGAAAADLLVDKMRSDNREIRYYATVCAAELRPRSALPALVERLFDDDYGVRATATEALSGYPAHELDLSLARARQALHSDDASRVKAAADALAELADVAAIPDLLDVASGSGKGSEHARRALVRLSKQDFGTSARKWRSWWSKNQHRSRIEWLIEGLAHKDEILRKSAAEELRRLTGEYFGYHHDLPRKERENARRRWLQWWTETGRMRFVRRDPEENSRTTATLPARRD